MVYQSAERTRALVPESINRREQFGAGCSYGKRESDLAPRKIKAEAWFDCWEARGQDIYEQTMRVGDEEILTILLLTDRRMLEERN